MPSPMVSVRVRHEEVRQNDLAEAVVKHQSFDVTSRRASTDALLARKTASRKDTRPRLAVGPVFFVVWTLNTRLLLRLSGHY